MVPQKNPLLLGHKHKALNSDTKEKRKSNGTVHLELVRLLDDHLQAAVLSQDGFPHLGYPAGFFFLGAQLPFCAV